MLNKKKELAELERRYKELEKEIKPKPIFFQIIGYSAMRSPNIYRFVDANTQKYIDTESYSLEDLIELANAGQILAVSGLCRCFFVPDAVADELQNIASYLIKQGFNYEAVFDSLTDAIRESMR